MAACGMVVMLRRCGDGEVVCDSEAGLLGAAVA